MLRKLVSAHVVIGAGYGDEGKGVLTDALAARHGDRATVIRFNGGAQAGHTVTLADGRRHIFHHVGSGTLAGAATYLSRFFVANPILLAGEIAALTGLGAVPRIAIDPAAPVTTPYDMMINQMSSARAAADGTGAVAPALARRWSAIFGRNSRSRLTKLRTVIACGDCSSISATFGFPSASASSTSGLSNLPIKTIWHRMPFLSAGWTMSKPFAVPWP